MSSPYSTLKVIHHQQRLKAIREGRQPAPSQVHLVISDLCSHACDWCAYRSEGYTSNELFPILNADGSKNNNPARMIPTPKVKEILDDCKAMGVHAVQFTGGGEPTVHPDHAELFAYALDLGLEIALVTHGGIMRDGVPELLARAAWVRFSLDAGEPETYARTRRVSADQMGRAIANIEKVVAAKRRAGSATQIGVGFVVTKDNFPEVIKAATIARDAGVDNFRISALFTSENAEYFVGFNSMAADFCRAAEAKSTDTFRVINRFSDRIDDLAQASPDYEFCGYQHFATYIGGDQNVYRCCNTAYNSRGLIGSLKNQRFADLWESEEKWDAFAGFDARGCERCMFNQQNRTILYAIEPRPVHVNFV